MATVTIELPSQAEQTGFNLRRWEELLKDPAMQKIEGRIETDRHGRVIMSPPPAPRHGSLQSKISGLLAHLMEEGEVLTECPISTADGVRAADVAWASEERMRELGGSSCFPHAPEICVEVRSPDERWAALEEKTRLYFDAGAKEVWVCDKSGRMTFFEMPGEALTGSKLCSEFPALVPVPEWFGE